MSIPLVQFQIFSQIRGDILKWMFITGVNNTGNNFFTGVNDTGDKFIAIVIASVVDTGDKFIAGDNIVSD